MIFNPVYGGDASPNLGAKTITSNGTYQASSDNLDGYSEVTANVPNTYAAADEGKVVNNGALVAQTSRSITANGTYDTTLNDEVVVNVSGGGGATLITKTITENGTYNAADDNADGYSQVTVDVPTGGGINWRDQLAVNWDFSNPVNTRGASSYGNRNLIYTLDGWQLQGGLLTFGTNGIVLSRYASNTAGFFMQRFKAAMTSAIVGRQVTFSAIVDGVLNYATATVPSASGDSGFGFACNGVYFRGYGYGTEIALTVDIAADTGSHLIQAIKFEAGATQTLATQVNGVWVLNNSMDAGTEYIKARDGTVYN